MLKARYKRVDISFAACLSQMFIDWPRIIYRPVDNASVVYYLFSRVACNSLLQ